MSRAPARRRRGRPPVPAFRVRRSREAAYYDRVMAAEILRPARAGDREAIERLVEAAYGGYVERIGRRPAPMDADYTGVIGAGRVTAADGDGGVVGVIVLEPMAGHLLVENVAVDPRAQRTGLGRRLMAH